LILSNWRLKRDVSELGHKNTLNSQGTFTVHMNK